MNGRNHKGWHLPFEENPMFETDAGLIARGVVVMASVAPTPIGMFPAITLRFDVPGLTTMPTVTMLMDPERLREVPSLVLAAVNAAVKKAKEGS